MPNISDNLNAFTTALEKNIIIICNDNGEWQLESTCEKVSKTFYSTFLKTDESMSIVKAFCKALDNLEKTPVEFKNNMKVTQPQYSKFLAYLNAARALKTKLNQSQTLQLNLLERRIIGLKYRIEGIHGGLDKKVITNELLFKNIVKSAESWKTNQILYPILDKTLTNRDLKKIEETCLYPEFAKLISIDKKLRDNFFKWAIRDNNKIPIFIEFPSTCDLLHKSNIDKRTGYLNPDLLTIKKTNIKDITLPFFDGKKTNFISILDRSKKIELNGNLSISINNIFQTFKNKKTTTGNLEFFKSKGIMNWGTYEYGQYNKNNNQFERINLNIKHWWQELPIFEELTKAETEKRYNLSLNNGNWIKCIRSTRESLDYKVMKKHGFFEVAIPLNKGNYSIYPFGKYPANFPTTTLGLARLLMRTTDARIQFPDENIFYSHRQHTLCPILLNETQGLQLMESIKNEISKSLRGQLNFQMAGENCAHWVQSTAFTQPEEKHFNPFKMPAINMQPTDKILNTFIQNPDSKKTYALIKTLRFFATCDGRSVIENGKETYKTTELGKTVREIYQFRPGYLSNQVEEKKLQGKICYGN